ncbi:MARCKS-related protein [Fukomys damarensis]|uniref:MARCKS-related protein n=1 Tax=Fukomys damarensis TaxID=885580 RepID=UPI001455AE3D|nr:MARCKS-related protein [Fukomys damarensis]
MWGGRVAVQVQGGSAPGRLPAQCSLARPARSPGICGPERFCAEYRAHPGGEGGGTPGPQRLLPAALSQRAREAEGRGLRDPECGALGEAKAENGHVKSNGDLSPKGEGESPPVNGTDEAAGATGDAIEPAPPSQGAEAKGEAPPKETPKKKKKFSFKKPFKLSGLSFKRNRKEGGGDSSASSPTEEEQEQGEIGACSEEGTAQEGKAADTPESQEPQAKGAEASAAAKGGDAEEEAGPQAAEPSTPSGPESEPAPASASAEQNE